MVKQAELTFTVTRLGAALGAEVRGLDLSGPIDDEDFARLRAAFLEHCVLVFRDQDLTPADHVAFTARWGEPEVLEFAAHVEGYPALTYLDNELSEKLGPPAWHSDAMAFEEPPLGSLLYAREIPALGGDTAFANQYLAYDALSPGLKRLLEGCRGLNSLGETWAKKMGKDPDLLPSATHPIVRTHPETGGKALYACAYFTTQIEDMTVEESQPILDYLYRHAARPEFVYRHQWRPGDLLMWDNRCTQHYPVADYGAEPRYMHRSTLRGDRPR